MQALIKSWLIHIFKHPPLSKFNNNSLKICFILKLQSTILLITKTSIFVLDRPFYRTSPTFHRTWPTFYRTWPTYNFRTWPTKYLFKAISVKDFKKRNTRTRTRVICFFNTFFNREKHIHHHQLINQTKLPMISIFLMRKKNPEPV